MYTAVYSRLCCNNFALGGILAITSRSSALSAPLIVSEGYRFLLAFINAKSFSLIRSIDFRSTFMVLMYFFARL